MKNQVLLYGASGYTGKLIAELASEQHFKLVVCGRNQSRIQEIAERFQFEYETASLEDPELLHRILQRVKVVIHAAGPFQRTAIPMIEACIRAGTHYIDITGEIEVFEAAKQYNKAAIAAGIIIMPGAGFDVVPTDCLSLYLKNKLPKATRLQIAFSTVNGGLSHGTASTMIAGLGQGGMERRSGKLVSVPLGKYCMNVHFGEHDAFMMSIPWGDVSTAYHTTGIPNIRTYTGVPKSAYYLLKFQAAYNWLLRKSFVRNYLQKQIDKKSPGPDKNTRSKARSFVWAEATEERSRVQAVLTGPDGYTMTAHTSLMIAQKLLQEEHPAGYQTPAGLFGPDFILAVPGVTRIDR